MENVKLKGKWRPNVFIEFRSNMMLMPEHPTKFEKERKMCNDLKDVPSLSKAFMACDMDLTQMGQEKSFGRLHGMIIKILKAKTQDKYSKVLEIAEKEGSSGYIKQHHPKQENATLGDCMDHALKKAHARIAETIETKRKQSTKDTTKAKLRKEKVKEKEKEK